MHLTPETLEAVYRTLLTTLPFRRWNLPHPDKINFVVSMHRDRHAHHRAYMAPELGTHEIAVSAHKVKTLSLLTECMAHELCHLRQDQLRMRDQHGDGFKRLAALVCRHHGWALATF